MTERFCDLGIPCSRTPSELLGRFWTLVAFVLLSVVGTGVSHAEAQPDFEPFDAEGGVVMSLPTDWEEVHAPSEALPENPRSSFERVQKIIQRLGPVDKIEAEIAIYFLLPQQSDVKQSEMRRWPATGFDEVRKQLQKMGQELPMLPGSSATRSSVVYVGFSVLDGYYCINTLIQVERLSGEPRHLIDSWQCPLEEGLFQIRYETEEAFRQTHLRTFARIKESIDFPDL